MTRLAFGDPDHGTSAVDQQSSEASIAALADAEQGLFAAAGVLPRNESKPGNQRPAIIEIFASPINATSALAVIGPIPGIRTNFRLAPLSPCRV